MKQVNIFKVLGGIEGNLNVGIRKKIVGIGRHKSRFVFGKLGLNKRAVFSDLEKEIQEGLFFYLHQQDLGEEIFEKMSLNIKKKGDLLTYQGIRHKFGMPVRGQSTKNNWKTARKLNVHILPKEVLYGRLRGREARTMKRKASRMKKQERKSRR